MSATLAGMTAQELRGLRTAGQVSCREIAQAHLDRAASVDRHVGAFLHLDSDVVLRQADALDERSVRGEELPPLAGIPVAIKDNMCRRGERATCASRMLENFVAPYDADVIARLRDAGAILFGGTNLDEFAMGSSCENSAFAVTRNPWNLECAPGGSSGGSAAAVAGGMTPLALGSDTGGSIRQPAAYCGIVGMKPTYGRVSRYGLIAFASSLDQIGPFAHTVGDAALLLSAIAGHSPRDSTSIAAPLPGGFADVEEPLAGLRIGLAREHFGEGIHPEVEQAVREAVVTYQRLGAMVHDVALPHTQYCVAVYYVAASSEASSNLARYDGVHYGLRAESFDSLADMYAASRAAGFGDEVKRRIMLGTYALASGYYDAYYKKALQVRRLIRQDYDEAYRHVDVILSPVTTAPAFRIGELIDDPLAMYLTDIYTISANLAGLPAISLPCGFSSTGLPIGLQLTAAPLDEARLLRAARMYERETDWHERRPRMEVAT